MPVRIVEWKLPYTWGTGIWIDANKVISLLLRDENNLIQVNADNEVYTDLQLADGIEPTDDFPVWVTVWKVLQTDGWTQNGIILNYKTTSWDYCRWIYANDGELYFDKGNGVRTHIYYSSEVDTLLANLRAEIYQYFIRYQDYYRVTKTWNQFNLELSCEITPDQNFVVDAPLNIEEWQTYVLRVHNWATSYVMSLWAYVTNPKWTNIALNPNTTDTFVFLAVDDTRVELQPIADPTSSVNDGILTIQKNWTTVWTFTANQATNSTINITTPTVVDDLTTQSSTNALSANQWYVLKGMIDDLAGFGKFLSLRDATTWLPISFPLQTPYAYSTWDYFVVETISSATPPVNYRPSGSSYTGTASSTTESDELEVWDVYVYDGSVWLLQSNHWKTVSFANIAWDPYDNTNLSNALWDKQDTLIAWSNITIAADWKTISANNTTYSSATSSTAWIVKLWSDTVQTEAAQTPSATTWKSYAVQLNSSWQMLVNVPRANTTYSSLPAASWWADVSLVTTGEKYTWNNKQDALVSWTNIKTVNSNSLLGSWDVSINDIKVSSSAPASPTEWIAWYDTTNDVLKVYDGSNWKVTGSDGEWVRIFKLTTDTPDATTKTAIAEAIRWSVSWTSASSEIANRFLYPVYIERANDSYDSEEDAYNRNRVIYKLTYYNASAGSGFETAILVANMGTQLNILTIQWLNLATSSTYTYTTTPLGGWITNDTTWTTTTVTKIRAWTEAEYALITPDANTIYHVY